MVKTTFFVGLNDKDTKKQELPTIECVKRIENIFNTLTEGATLKECRGVYKHTDGTKIVENTIECICYDLQENRIAGIAQALKSALNQESVLIEKTQINSLFL